MTNSIDNINVIEENFDEPMIAKPPVGRALTTDFDLTSEQAEWAVENLSSPTGTVSISFVSDPVAGAVRGKVMKVTTASGSGSIPVARVYPASGTIKGTSILGIRNGRVRIYYRLTSNANMLSLTLRVREVDANNYYRIYCGLITGGGNSIEVSRVVNGSGTRIDGFFTTSIGGGYVIDSQWHWMEWTWWEGTDSFGTRLYFQVQYDTGGDGYAVDTNGASTRQPRKYWIDESPAFSTDTGTIISILKDNNGGSSNSIHIDDITVERWM